MPPERGHYTVLENYFSRRVFFIKEQFHSLNKNAFLSLRIFKDEMNSAWWQGEQESAE